MGQHDQTKWFGIKPTVLTAQSPAGKVTVNDSSTGILGAQPDRTSFIMRNTGSVDVYIRFGTPATTNDMPMETGDVLSCNDYTGTVYGIVSSGTGEIRVIVV